MLYQKGEKLKELQQTIKNIPTLSGIKESDFVMPEKAIRQFEKPIRRIFNELNNVLYSTLISSESQEEKTDKVYKTVGQIVLYLEEHYKEDVIDNFYEEKLVFYQNMFVILVKNELCVRYREYEDILKTIPSAYWKTVKEHKPPTFRAISCFISDYQDISKDIKNFQIQEQTETYLTHCLELILEKISELIKDECKEEFLDSDFRTNRIRHLIYLLKSELSLDLQTEE